MQLMSHDIELFDDADLGQYSCQRTVDDRQLRAVP